MLSELFTCSVIFSILLYFPNALAYTSWLQNHVLENVRLTTNIGLLTAPSVIACAVKCAKVLPCMSYSYHVGNNKCLLYPIPFTNKTTGKVNEDGWKTYNSMCGNRQSGLNYFYKRNLNMCYHLESNQLKNATEAVVFCADGGRLLRINRIEKQAHIVEVLTSLQIVSAYIGGSSENRDNIFMYEDGTLLTVFFWYPGNPKGQNAIRMRSILNFTWANTKGRRRTPYLCESKLDV